MKGGVGRGRLNVYVYLFILMCVGSADEVFVCGLPGVSVFLGVKETVINVFGGTRAGTVVLCGGA